MTSAAAAAWMAHVLALHLHIPEPVSFEVREAVPGFERTADASMDADGRGGWVVRYDPAAFAQASSARVRFVVAHELCHGLYNHTPGAWSALDMEGRRREHQRVKACAERVLFHHREGVNHAAR